MSRLEKLSNRCFFNFQYAVLEKCGLAAIEGVFFVWKTDFWVVVHMEDKSIHRALHLFLHNT